MAAGNRRQDAGGGLDRRRRLAQPTRLIVVTGKGGVGKTTTAAATAIACAAKGHRTLVVSTDPAHSLADALDQPAGPVPTERSEPAWTPCRSTPAAAWRSSGATCGATSPRCWPGPASSSWRPRS